MGFGVGAALGLALLALGSEPAFANGKGHSLLIRTDVAGVSITKNDLRFGNAGEAIDILPGVHRLLLSGNSISPRIVPVLIPPQPDAYVIDVGFRQGRSNSNQISFPSPSKWRGSLPLVRLSSYCQNWKKVPPKVQQQFPKIDCDRQTLRDDIQYFESDLFRLSDPKDVADDELKFLMNARQEKGSDEYYWRLERFVAKAPERADAAKLLLYSAASRGDCLRVLEVAAEWAAVGKVPDWMRLFEGYCVLMQSGLRTTLEAAANIDQEDPTVLFLVAAQLGAPGGKATNKLLQACMKKRRLHYPCYQLLAILNLQRKDQKSARRVLKIFRNRARAHLEKVDLTSIGMAVRESGKGRGMSITRGRELSPFQFETVAAVIIGDYQNKRPIDPFWQDRLQNTVAVHLGKARAMVKTLEKYQDPLTLQACYRVLARSYPEEAFYWVKWANTLKKLGRVSQALDQVRQANRYVTKAQDRNVLKFAEGELLVALDRYDDAEQVFLEVKKRQPENWKIHYNLGAVQERLGKSEAAGASFKETLKHNPPVQYRINIEQKLKSLNR